MHSRWADKTLQVCITLQKPLHSTGWPDLTAALRLLQPVRESGISSTFPSATTMAYLQKIMAVTKKNASAAVILSGELLDKIANWVSSPSCTYTRPPIREWSSVMANHYGMRTMYLPVLTAVPTTLVFMLVPYFLGWSNRYILPRATRAEAELEQGSTIEDERRETWAELLARVQWGQAWCPFSFWAVYLAQNMSESKDKCTGDATLRPPTCIVLMFLLLFPAVTALAITAVRRLKTIICGKSTCVVLEEAPVAVPEKLAVVSDEEAFGRGPGRAW